MAFGDPRIVENCWYPVRFVDDGGKQTDVANAHFWAEQRTWGLLPDIAVWGIVVQGELAKRFTVGTTYRVEVTNLLKGEIRHGSVKCLSATDDRADFERTTSYNMPVSKVPSQLSTVKPNDSVPP